MWRTITSQKQGRRLKAVSANKPQRVRTDCFVRMQSICIALDYLSILITVAEEDRYERLSSLFYNACVLIGCHFCLKKDKTLKIKKFLVYLFLKLPEIDSGISIFGQLKYVEYARIVVERFI